MEIIFATKNEGKLKEIKEILKPHSVVSMNGAGIDIEIAEDGETFEENAVIKAKAVAAICGKTVLADDSGIEIDFLNGAPGVYSARYMGEDTPYTIKNAKIIEMMKDVPPEKRTARFVCAIAAFMPDGKVITKVASIEGSIAYEAAGCGGFGYDPIFYVPEFGMTAAQMSPAQKNSVSHRGKALKLMKEALLSK